MQQASQPTMAERRRRTAASSATTGIGAQQSSPSTPPPDATTSGPTMRRRRPYVPPPDEQEQDEPQPRPRSRPQQQEQDEPQTTRPLHNGNATQLGNGSVEWKAFGQTVYVRDATKHPPMASFIIAFIIGIFAVGAIVMQMITTFSAYSNMVFDGKVWEHFTRAAQDAGRPVVNVAVVLIAVSFQA